MQDLFKQVLYFKKKPFLVFFLILILISSIITAKEYTQDYNNPITYSMGDLRWCQLTGCTIADLIVDSLTVYNLSVIGDVFNVTMNLVTWNITDNFNVGGNLIAKNGTFDNIAGNGSGITGILASSVEDVWVNETLEVGNQTFETSESDVELRLLSDSNKHSYLYLMESSIFGFRLWYDGSGTNIFKFDAIDNNVIKPQMWFDRDTADIDVFANIDMNDNNLSNVQCLELNDNQICSFDEINASIGDINISQGIGEHWLNDTGDDGTGNYTFGGTVFHIDDTNDRVGIGTTSPSAKLEVASPYDSGDVNQLLLTDSNDGAGTGVRVYMTAKDMDGGTVWAMGDTWDSALDFILAHAQAGSMFLQNNGYKVIEIQNDGDILLNNTNLFVDVSAGNVGIGTGSPTDKLDVAGAIRVTADSAFSASAGARFYKQSDLGLVLQGVTGTTTDLSIVTPDGQRLFDNPTGTDDVVLIPISATGNVGIGTSSPQEKLHVYNPTTTSRLEVESNGTSGEGAILKLTNIHGSFGWYTDATTHKLKLYDYENATDRITIDVDGDVGIGTTNPLEELHVKRTSGDVTVQLESTTDNAALVLDAPPDEYSILRYVSTATDWELRRPSNQLYLEFLSSGVGSVGSVMVLEKGGNVGIGTASPAKKLDITSTGDDQLRISYNGSLYTDFFTNVAGDFYIRPTGTTVDINTPTQPKLILKSVNDGGSTILLERKGGANTYSYIEQGASNIDALIFHHGSPYNQLVLLPTGNVGIGNTTPQHKLSVNGDIYTNQSIYAGGNIILNNKTISNVYCVNFSNGDTICGNSSIDVSINGSKYFSISNDGIRMFDDNGTLIAIFNDEERNNTARFEGSMMNNDNINDTSRFVERNLNNGSGASSALTVRNDIPYSASFGLTSSTFSYDRIGANTAGISSVAPGEMVFMQRYNYPIIWYINKENDSSIENLSEVMRLDEDGLNVSDNLNVVGNITGNRIYGNLNRGGNATTRPSSVNVSTGTLVSGNITSIQEIDGNVLDVDEVTGSPGFDIIVNYTNFLGTPRRVEYVGRYQGTTSHNVEIRIFNYSSGSYGEINDEIGDIPSSSENLALSFMIEGNLSDFVSDGIVSIQVIHTSNGVPSHKQFMDFLTVTSAQYSIPDVGQFVKIDNYGTSSDNGVKVDSVSGNMTILIPGSYRIEASSSFVGDANSFLICSVFKNDIEVNTLRFVRRLNAGGDIASACLGKVLDNLEVNDILNLRCASEIENSFVTFTNLDFYIERIGD